MSWTGLFRATISSSHPLHDPASTSRMARDRPGFSGLFRALSSEALDVRFGIHQLTINFTQPAMRAVGIQVYFAVRTRLRRSNVASSNSWVMRTACSDEASAHKPQKTQRP